MSAVANRRACVEAIRTLVTTSQPTEYHIVAAIKSLTDVINDMSDGKCRLEIVFDDDGAA